MGNNPQSLHKHSYSPTPSEEPMTDIGTNAMRWLSTFLTKEELQKLSPGELRLLIALQHEDPSQIIKDGHTVDLSERATAIWHQDHRC